MTEVTEDRYDEMHGVLPPIYFSELDGVPLFGFACSEPNDHNENGATFNIYWKHEDRFFSAEANLISPKGRKVWDPYKHQFGSGYKAVSTTEKGYWGKILELNKLEHV